MFIWNSGYKIECGCGSRVIKWVADMRSNMKYALFGVALHGDGYCSQQMLKNKRIKIKVKRKVTGYVKPLNNTEYRLWSSVCVKDVELLMWPIFIDGPQFFLRR